jgi:hypothetical protein
MYLYLKSYQLKLNKNNKHNDDNQVELSTETLQSKHELAQKSSSKIVTWDILTCDGLFLLICSSYRTLDLVGVFHHLWIGKDRIIDRCLLY